MSTESPTQNRVTDPVCGMRIDPANASRSSEYAGQTYYFCAPACRKAFDADPAAYLTGQADQLPMASTGCACCRG